MMMMAKETTETAWEYDLDRDNGNGRQTERLEDKAIDKSKDKGKNISKGRNSSNENNYEQSDYEYEYEIEYEIDEKDSNNNDIETIEQDLQPYKGKDEIKIKGKTSSNQKEIPHTEELESEILNWSNLFLPREVFEKMDKNTYGFYEKVQNKNEASWYKAKGLEIQIMHPFALNGSTVKIVNPENNNTVYARVVSNTQNNDIKISSNAMELLGIYDKNFQADFVYFVENKLGKHHKYI